MSAVLEDQGRVSTVREGVHEIGEDTYHADPCPAPSLSSSIAKLLVNKSPRHAWCAHPRLNPDYRPDNDQKFDLGSAFHTLYLGAGAQVVSIDAADWRTNAAKDARAAARKAGKIPMLSRQLGSAKSMVDAVKAQVDQHKEAAAAFATGLPERVITWKEDNGIWCRARLDWMPETGPAYPDLKSTEASASPEQWGRGIMFNIGCDIQDAFYRRGLRKLGICDDAFLLFVVAELEGPDHLMATHRCGMSAMAIGDRKVEIAIELWRACLERNRWPGYTQQTAWQDPPPWHDQQWADREFVLDQLIAAV